MNEGWYNYKGPTRGQPAPKRCSATYEPRRNSSVVLCSTLTLNAPPRYRSKAPNRPSKQVRAERGPRRCEGRGEQRSSQYTSMRQFAWQTARGKATHFCERGTRFANELGAVRLRTESRNAKRPPDRSQGTPPHLEIVTSGYALGRALPAGPAPASQRRWPGQPAPLAAQGMKLARRPQEPSDCRAHPRWRGARSRCGSRRFRTSRKRPHVRRSE